MPLTVSTHPAPERAVRWVAQDAGRTVGYALATTLFSTWHATDALDVYRCHVDDAARWTEVATALLNHGRRYAAEHGLDGVRWLWPEGAGGLTAGADPEPTLTSAADRRDKVRFTLATRAMTEEGDEPPVR